MPNGSRRVRDPQRRERILEAATTLFSADGYQAVNLKDVGALAGIVGSGIYRHFDNKMAILTELLDQVVDRLVSEALALVNSSTDPLVTLVSLLTSQARVTLDDRQLYRIYLRESRQLSPEDQSRLRLKQRRYVGLWQEALLAVDKTVSIEEAQVVVHASINAVHSVLRYHPALVGDDLERALVRIGCRTLGIGEALAERGVEDDPRALLRDAPADLVPLDSSPS